jgi:hypothetical protein
MQTGFDWVHNYWCNLLNEHGLNGELNPARPFAIGATLILCTGIGLFFYGFSGFLPLSKRWNRLIRYAGIVSLLLAALIITELHDSIILSSSLAGLMALLGVLKTIHYYQLNIFIWTGYACIGLIAMCNVSYYTHFGLAWLPLIQKIAFLCILIWIMLLQVYVVNRARNEGFAQEVHAK